MVSAGPKGPPDVVETAVVDVDVVVVITTNQKYSPSDETFLFISEENFI